VLFALLLIVHGIQFLHHHPKASFSSLSQSHTGQKPLLVSDQTGLGTQHCAICDFHVAKDVDLSVPDLTIPAMRFTCDIPVHHFSLYHAALAAVLRLRGPPVTG
jgi:hypothetical protein